MTAYYRSPEEVAAARAVMAAKPFPPFPIPDAFAAEVALPADYAYSVPGFEDALAALQFAAKRLDNVRGLIAVRQSRIAKLEAELAEARGMLAAAQSDHDVALAWVREMSREVAK